MKGFLVMQAEDDWGFKDGKAAYSSKLETEILSVSQWIDKQEPLDSKQLQLIRNVFLNLYQNSKVKIVKPHGRGKGSIGPDMLLLAYMAVKKVDEENQPVLKAIKELAEEYSVGAKKLEKAYYFYQEEIRQSLLQDTKEYVRGCNGSDLRCNYRLKMDYAVTVNLK